MPDASLGPFHRFVTTSAGCMTPTRPSLPYTTSNESLRLVGRFARPPSALHPASIWRPPPPTSPRGSLVASSASICPTLDGSPGLHLLYTRPPSGVHHHQRVLATRWWLPQPPSALHPASICPPPQPTSLDDLLVASPASICPTPPPTSPRNSLDDSPGLHLPYTTTNESSRLVGRFPRLPSALRPASIWPPPPPTSPGDSLVASSASIYPTPGLHLPPTTTNES